ncbi:MAG: class I mannose-6-phosphate isomerase [Clostridia bacterium]|nr:class I mannose-6-phosphate isomerase [Clostridia bacterium]
MSEYQANRYPMQISPVCRSTIWGGNRMRERFGFVSSEENIAEAWMLSARDDHPATVQNGFLAGKRIDHVIAEDPSLIAVSNTEPVCPLLIKFIDAEDKLSVQVHPDDAYAQAVNAPDPRGKTEMWVILEAAPDAALIMGTKRACSPAELRDAIESNTLLSLLQRVPVKKGDVFFIPSGLIHAIGEGILLAEIQQNCDTTYRVYDYERRQADGSLRPLHIEDSIACSRHFTAEEIDALRFENGDRNTLADCKYFRVTEETVPDSRCFCVGADSFVSLLVTSGSGTLSHAGIHYPLFAGASYFLPADMGEYTVCCTKKEEPLCMILSKQ